MLPSSQTFGRLRTESGPMRYYVMECQLFFVRGTILYLGSIKPHSPTICFPSGNVGFLRMLWIWDMGQTLATAPGDILFIHVPSNANKCIMIYCYLLIVIYCYALYMGGKWMCFFSFLSPVRKTFGTLRNGEPSSPSKSPSLVCGQCCPSCLGNLESWELYSWFPAHTQLTHTDFHRQPQKQEQDTQSELSFLTRTAGWPRTQLAHDGEGTEGELPCFSAFQS